MVSATGTFPKKGAHFFTDRDAALKAAILAGCKRYVLPLAKRSKRLLLLKGKAFDLPRDPNCIGRPQDKKPLMPSCCIISHGFLAWHAPLILLILHRIKNGTPYCSRYES